MGKVCVFEGSEGAEKGVALGRGGREGNCTANDRRREREKKNCVAQIKSGAGLISVHWEQRGAREQRGGGGGGEGDFPLCTTKAYWLNSFQAFPRPRRFFWKTCWSHTKKENLTQTITSNSFRSICDSVFFLLRVKLGRIWWVGGGEVVRQPHKPRRRVVGWMEAALEQTAKKKKKLE